METILATLKEQAQQHLLKDAVIERVIFAGMGAALIGNALMGSESWAALGGVVCASGLLAMFAGVATYTFLDSVQG